MAVCEHCRQRPGRRLDMEFRAHFHEAHDHLCHDCIALLIRKNEEQDDRLIGYVDYGPKPTEAMR